MRRLLQSITTACRVTCLVAVSIGLAVGQTTPCKGPLSEESVRDLIASGVGDQRLEQIISECGAAFRTSAEVEGRLKSAGATDRVLTAVRDHGPSAAPQSDDTALRAELEYWSSVKDLRDPAVFEDYLRRYPNGRFAVAAKAKLSEIKKAEPAGSPGAGDATAKRAPDNDSLKLEFVKVSSGEFSMGCVPTKKEGCQAMVKMAQPLHRVRITQPFEIAKCEVTQAQWEAVMGNNPSENKGADHPVENVTYDQAQDFLKRLTARSDGFVYRLPTEAEWEYAARAGGDGPTGKELKQYAWFYSPKSFSFSTKVEPHHPVGQKQPNAWGLYDMLGNVAEMCQDWFSPFYYRKSAEADPKGPATGDEKWESEWEQEWSAYLVELNRVKNTGLAGLVEAFKPLQTVDMKFQRVVRGGSFATDASLRVPDRFWFGQYGKSNDLGFRVARVQRSGN